MPQRLTCFCGIDIGKRRHVACLLDAQGQPLIKKLAFANEVEGFARLRQCLQEVAASDTVLVGMEATGHYWYALHDQLRRWGYVQQVLNPLQSAQQIKNAIRKHKSDPSDAGHIATLIKNGEGKPALIPNDLAMTCRQLTRLWYALGKQRARVKQLIHARLECVWPEFETYLSKPFGATGRAILRAAPTPEDLLAMNHETLVELIRKASRNRLGATKAASIRDSAQTSIGMRRGLEGMRVSIRTLLDQLNATTPVREQLETQITELCQRLPSYLLTLPGSSPIRAVSLFGETDPISTFKTPDQLVAFAGLDVTVYQTGQFEASRRHISKRGSPYLRHTLWMMAFVAVHAKGPLRRHYLKRRKRGLHHLAAVTATSLKLARIVWRICTDQRDYKPKPPEPKTASSFS
ncbi:MAG: IS110 family transposase [Phycisphaerales bacterium]|nr:IS110 family transposase [Phycisphaerales bacterium]